MFQALDWSVLSPSTSFLSSPEGRGTHWRGCLGVPDGDQWGRGRGNGRVGRKTWCSASSRRRKDVKSIPPSNIFLGNLTCVRGKEDAWVRSFFTKDQEDYGLAAWFQKDSKSEWVLCSPSNGIWQKEDWEAAGWPGQEEARQQPCLGSWLKCLGVEQMVFKMKVSSIHLKGKVESGLKWGDLAMKITAGVRHSNLEKYSGAGTNTADFSCSNCHWRTRKMAKEHLPVRVKVHFPNRPWIRHVSGLALSPRDAKTLERHDLCLQRAHSPGGWSGKSIRWFAVSSLMGYTQALWAHRRTENLDINWGRWWQRRLPGGMTLMGMSYW